MPLFAVWAEKEGNDQVVRKVVSSDNDDKVFLPLTADNPEMLKNPDFIEQIKKEFEAQNKVMLDHPKAPGRHITKLVFNEDGSIKGFECTPIEPILKDETAGTSKDDEKPAEAKGDGKKA